MPSAFVLAQVLHTCAEPRAVAEVLLDDVAQVVDGDEDSLEPEPDEVEDQPLDDGPTGDRDHRLGQVLGQRTKAHALAAGHDDRPVRPDDGLQELLEQVEADGTAVGIDDGDGIDAASAHELQRGRAAIASGSRTGSGGSGRVATGSWRSVPPSRARRRSPSVTTPVRRPSASTASAIRAAPRSTAAIASRTVPRLRDEIGIEGAAHGPGSWRRAGMPTTVTPGSIDSTTTAPIPTTAPAPISMWSRTRAPRPMKARSADAGRRRR